MAQPLKDQFDRDLVVRIAAAGRQAMPSFDEDRFVTAVMEDLDALELKDRVNRIADELFVSLGAEITSALAPLIDIAAIMADFPDGSSAWGSGMEAWPMCSVVERHGVDQPVDSLAAMPALTATFSCEFALRPFLTEHREMTADACRTWTTSPVPAVRRLASEGTRPYLPWGQGVAWLITEPDFGIGLLERLRHDPDEVVRRSVANHLNDLGRHAPDRAAEIVMAWRDEPGIDAAMLRHGLRGLVKRGHEGALAALGYTTEAEIDVVAFDVGPSDIRLGDSIVLDAEVASTSSQGQRLVVDFVIHHVRADGSTSPKVFKWTTIDLDPGERRTLNKRRRIATASTRKYHAGTHRVELQVAGTVVAEGSFELLESS